MEKLIGKLANELGINSKKLKSKFNKSFQFIEYEPSYFRFKNEIEGIEQGTVAFLGGKKIEIIRGYPKIKRVLVIETGFKKIFKEAYVEEKMNGYNVRTVSIDGNLHCITRKGLVDNYTTLRVENEINKRFFEDNPDLYLCGEVIGLQNPYQEKSYPEENDFGYYVFDIKEKKTGNPLNYDQKWKMIKKYNLKAVRNFGKYSNGKELLKLTRALGKKQREGIVIKSFDMKKILKYTANQSTNEDFRYAFNFYEDYGISFIYKRLLREAFQAYELGLSEKELEKEASELGKSILIPMVSTIKSISENKEVTEDFEITVPDEEFGYDFVDNLKHLGVSASIKKIRKKGENLVMKISRHYPSTNDKTKHYLKGGIDNE